MLMNIETGTTKVFMDIAKQIPMWIWLIVIALVTRIEFAVFYLSYGCFAQNVGMTSIKNTSDEVFFTMMQYRDHIAISFTHALFCRRMEH